jgi:DNA-binding NtrC family response regulator/tetratricopeptide (TPR) repeat protein
MTQPRPTSPTDPTKRLLGTSAAIADLRTQIRHLAAFDVVGSAHVPTVLIAGETGTGKGLVARMLHDSGPRTGGPFLEVNCAAIPDTMLEAELFGFEAGAFTDAKRPKPGLFEAAAKGTLFLDEIDALPVLLQSKLLKAIEEKQMRRLGAVGERPVDVKIIAATAADLQARTADGRFRLDLYHRLAVLLVALPPLRARGEDIVGLARHFLQHYAAGYRLPPKRLSRDAEAWLQHYAWPGNVRELGHLMERVTLLHPDALVTAEALARLCLPGGPPAVPPLEGHPAVDEPTQIRQALAQTQGNVVQAARRLGWSRKALLYRMRRHGIEAPPRPRGRPLRAAREEEEPAPAPPGALPAVASGAEQKPVAVLAIELTFPEPAGPAYEPWTAARRWEQALVEKVRGFGGTLVQQGPALLLVAFGLPRTLEQLPQRAIQTALALRHLAVESEPGPTLRQAAHWGPVLVDVPARAPAQGLLPRGDTLALPVRLLGQAGPGEIVLSPALGRLVVGWCALEALPPPAGEGDPVQVSAYRVRGVVPRRSPLAGLSAQALSPFVGREHELAALEALLAAVEGGRGQAVGIVGEPGVGKSRLLVEFRRGLAGRRVTYLEGRCLSYGSTTPYLPVLELLRDTCDLAETDAPELVAEKVRLTLEEVGLDPDEQASYLLHLLGLPEGTERVAGVSPELLKVRTFESLCQLNLHGSRRQPLVMAIENLHWTDKTSEDFFTSLVERLADVPIFLIGTYRPGYRPPWIEKSYVTQLALPPLAPADSRSLVQAVGRTVPLPERMVQIILAKAEGNPLFLEELTRAVLEQDDARAVAALPDTLQGVLLARIDRLPVDAKRALQLASVVGRECSLRLLEALWDGAAPLPDALARLVEAELLYQQGAPPQATYRFRHALIREAAYQALLQTTRQETHRRIAQVLEGRFPEIGESQPELVAHHFTEAGHGAQALPYWQRAGQRAIERSAHVEAISHLTKGLEALKTLPETPERNQQELTLQLALGAPLLMIKGHTVPEVEYTYTRARELCQQVGESPQLFLSLVGLWRFYLNRGRLQTARDLAEQCFTLAQHLQDSVLLQEAHLMLGSILYYLGELVAARVHLEQGIALYDTQQSRSRVLSSGTDPGVVCLSRAARVLWMLGYPDQALARSNEALTLARRLSHDYSLGFALFHAAAIHCCRGEIQEVEELATAAISLSSKQGFVHWLGTGMSMRGWALAMQGRAEEGINELLQGLATMQSYESELGLMYHRTMLAEAYGRGGQAKEGLFMLIQALAGVHQNTVCHYEAELHRLKGELSLQQALQRGDKRTAPTGTSWVAGAERGVMSHTPPVRTEAEICFRYALNIARRQSAKSLELRAAMSLSRLWQQGGKCAEAHQMLAGIYGWFTEGFETRDLQEAKALLEALA